MGYQQLCLVRGLRENALTAPLFWEFYFCAIHFKLVMSVTRSQWLKKNEVK